jgi:hypothetical protein
MKIDEFPNLLVATKLINPIDISLKNICELQQNISADLNKIILQGSLVMAVSSLEVMLSDVFEYFLVKFPHKLPASDFKFSKEEFFGNYYNLIKKSAGSYIIGLSYKSFNDYFNKFTELLSVSFGEDRDSFLDEIIEIKATRNLILHNKLIVNEQYMQSAGNKRRDGSKGSKLSCDYIYVAESMKRIIEFEIKIKELILEKYIDYTKIRANKVLWSFMFKSPIMQYDDFWDYDEVKDTIDSYKESPRENNLSGTEKIRLGLWRAHFTGSEGHVKIFNMKHFDQTNQEKVLFFLSIADEFSFD